MRLTVIYLLLLLSIFINMVLYEEWQSEKRRTERFRVLYKEKTNLKTHWRMSRD